MSARTHHLTPAEMTRLAASSPSASADDEAERQLIAHLNACDDCRELAQTHARLQRLRIEADAAAKAEEECPAEAQECPAEVVWLEFAAGLRVEQTQALTAHAAACGACAVAFHEALELLAAEPNAEAGSRAEAASYLPEAVPMERPLASETPAWQHEVAAQMAALASSSRPREMPAAPVLKFPAPDPQRFRSIFRFGAAAALLIGAVLGSLVVWRSVHPSESRLLALAYNKQRTMALRLPGTDPAPMASITRGADRPPGAMNRTAELSELYTRARVHLDRTPDDAYWHQVMGEVDLLDRDPKAALHDFQFAQIKDSTLPGLLPDLAAAWFEAGELSGQSSDYARAAELYLEELAQLGDGRAHRYSATVLHYNLGLCFARQHLTENARAEFLAARTTEKSTAWRAAIDEELGQLQGAPLSSALKAGLDRDAYETEANHAMTDWLPLWPQRAEAKAQLAATAQLGHAHADEWLADWIAVPHTEASQAADAELAQALAAAGRGDPQTSLTHASAAHALYAQVRHRPGMLRAVAAEGYAYLRLGQTERCIQAAQSVEQDAQSSRYGQMRLRSMVDHAICAERAGDFATSRQELRRALAEEPRHHLPQLRLSTISMQAALLHDAGETLASWQQDVTALALCSRTDCSAVRRYSFFYDLVRSAQDLQLPRVAEALMHTAVGLAEQTHDAVTRAYAWETLGRVAGKAQDFSMAAQAFDHARQVAHQDNQAALGALYQAEWKADEAEILELQQKPDAAESLLRQSAATLLASDYVPGRIKFYQQASIAALTLGHRAEALEDALAAVRESERALDKLGSADARAQWTREKAPIYGQFVQASLSQGGAQQGFEAWERFRRAPFVHDAALSLPASPTGAAATPHRTVLVLALTGGTYHGWLVDGDSLHVLRSVALGDRRTIQQQVVAFYRLCADRDSNLSDLRALGRKLYTALLAPLAVTGAGAAERLDHLRVDLDPSLAVLPLGALTLPNGRWLSDAYEVTVLPPWWTLTPATALSDAAIASDARALVVDGFDNASDRSESAEIVKLLHGATLVEGSSASPAKVLASLAESDTFHFAGHSSDGSTSLLMSSQAPEELLSPAQVEHAHLARCRVAILAACNTTAADPDQMEKLPDLRDALLQAGVANVIASSWDVDDASTRALMVALYRQLASHIPIAHALRAAEAAVHSENRWQHPFYWAPFEHFTH